MDGKTIDDSYYILTINCWSALSEPDTAEVQISWTDDTGSEIEKLFEIDARLEIGLGYHSKNKEVFSGVITEQWLQLDENHSIFSVVGKSSEVRKDSYDLSQGAVLKLTYGKDIFAYDRIYKNVDNPALNLGRVTFVGNADVQPGNMVDIAGMTSHFNGKALVARVAQELAEGQWETSIKIGLPKKP